MREGGGQLTYRVLGVSCRLNGLDCGEGAGRVALKKRKRQRRRRAARGGEVSSLDRFCRAPPSDCVAAMRGLGTGEDAVEMEEGGKETSGRGPGQEVGRPAGHGLNVACEGAKVFYLCVIVSGLAHLVGRCGPLGAWKWLEPWEAMELGNHRVWYFFSLFLWASR